MTLCQLEDFSVLKAIQRTQPQLYCASFQSAATAFHVKPSFSISKIFELVRFVVDVQLL